MIVLTFSKFTASVEGHTIFYNVVLAKYGVIFVEINILNVNFEAYMGSWRNWTTRSATNRKIAGSSPAELEILDFKQSI